MHPFHGCGGLKHFLSPLHTRFKFKASFCLLIDLILCPSSLTSPGFDLFICHVSWQSLPPSIMIQKREQTLSECYSIDDILFVLLDHTEHLNTSL